MITRILNPILYGDYIGNILPYSLQQSGTVRTGKLKSMGGSIALDSGLRVRRR